ncbi:MAG TPA: hypothetical protein VFD85_15045 [Gemmatimonadales bacterium]|nr:hypothetical protein [Gemmatimonadales bacterium]
MVGICAIIAVTCAGIVTVRWLSPKRASPALPPERERMLEDLQARLGELQQLKQRMGELEERLDFAERVLAQQRDANRISPA